MAAIEEVKKKHFSAEDKLRIVKAHLIDGIPVSKLCEQYQINPSLLYLWLKILFDRGSLAFERPNDRKTGPTASRHMEEKIATLDLKVGAQQEVIGEIMGEWVSLKKKSSGGI